MKDTYLIKRAMGIVNHINQETGVDVDTRQRTNDQLFDYVEKKLKELLAVHKPKMTDEQMVKAEKIFREGYFCGWNSHEVQRLKREPKALVQALEENVERWKKHSPNAGHQKENKGFGVKVTQDKHDINKINLSITHNSNHWTTIGIYSDDQREQIIKCLKETRDEHGK